MSESGKKWETSFSRQCGTTVTCQLEVRPAMVEVSGGTFDPQTFWYNLSGIIRGRNCNLECYPILISINVGLPFSG